MNSNDKNILKHMRIREYHLNYRQRIINKVLIKQDHLKKFEVLILSVLSSFILGSMLNLSSLSLNYDWDTQVKIYTLLAIIVFPLVFICWWNLFKINFFTKFLNWQNKRIYHKYSAILHAYRRWDHFYYEGEDISYYIPQLIYYIDKGNFNSIQSALSFIKSNNTDNRSSREYSTFNKIVRETNALAIASMSLNGKVSNRIMRFVPSDESPNIWYITTAPEAPKVAEFDNNNIAITTLPTLDGSTISSNNVIITKTNLSLNDIRNLYQKNVPGYVKGISDKDAQAELVYKLIIKSARMDSWIDHKTVVFDN